LNAADSIGGAKGCKAKNPGVDVHWADPGDDRFPVSVDLCLWRRYGFHAWTIRGM